MTRKSTERRAVKRKTGDLEEHMLHGPFNFKAHRAPGVKQEKTSSNLRDELITVVMQSGYIFLAYLFIIHILCLSGCLFVCLPICIQ